MAYDSLIEHGVCVGGGVSHENTSSSFLCNLAQHCIYTEGLLNDHHMGLGSWWLNKAYSH